MTENQSVLRHVPIRNVLDHYKTMNMQRYPSELCDLFRKHAPLLNRHAPEGSGTTLFYHYLLHGFRETELRILMVMDQDDDNQQYHFTCTKVLLGSYLNGNHKIVVATHETWENQHTFFDVIVFDHSADRFQSPEDMETMLFEKQMKAMAWLKQYGIVCFEGYNKNVSHYVYGTLCCVNLYPSHYEQHVSTLHDKSETLMTICKKLTPSATSPWERSEMHDNEKRDDVLVLITSSVTSKGNSNVFAENTRFRQLIHSIRSVYRNIPNAYVVVSETSRLSDNRLQQLREENVKEMVMFGHLDGVAKSLAEAIVLDNVVRHYFPAHEQQQQQQHKTFSAFCKLSGRYVLLDTAFVYTHPDRFMCKRMRPKEVMTRFFQIPLRGIATFQHALTKILACPKFQDNKIDIEHALGEHNPQMDEESTKWILLGVAGFYATVCQMIVE